MFNETKITAEMLLMQITFECKVSMNQKNEGKAFFQVFLQIHAWFLIDPKSCMSTFSEQYLVFAIFKPLPVSYKSQEHIHLILH